MVFLTLSDTFVIFFYYQILLVPLLNSVRSAIVRWWGEVTKIDSLGECLQPSSLQLTVQRFGKQSKERNSLKEFGMFSLSSLLVNKSTAKIKYNIHGYITMQLQRRFLYPPLKIVLNEFCFSSFFHTQFVYHRIIVKSMVFLYKILSEFPV